MMNVSVTTPVDVKLMNMTAMVLFLAFVVAGAVATARWMVRLPAFDIKGIAVSGDVSHNSALNLRANVAPRLAGTFFSIDLTQVRAAFEAVPWVRKAVEPVESGVAGAPCSRLLGYRERIAPDQ